MDLIEIASIRRAPVMGYSHVYTYFDDIRKKFKFHLTDEIKLSKLLYYINNSKGLKYNFIHISNNPVSIDEYENCFMITELFRNNKETFHVDKEISGTFDIGVNSLYNLVNKCDKCKVEFKKKKDTNYLSTKLNKLEFINNFIQDRIPSSKIIQYNDTSELIKVDGYLIKLSKKHLRLMYIGKKDIVFNLNDLPYKNFKLNELDKLIEEML